jgi:hypothetical protein
MPSKKVPDMGIIHVRISFFSRWHNWAIDYYAFGIGELQDEWRLRMDPMGDIGSGVTYQIKPVYDNE